MKKILPTIVAICVVGVLSSHLMATGMWGAAVVDPLRHVAGSEVAEQFDQTSRDVVKSGELAVEGAQSGDANSLLEQLNSVTLPEVKRIPKYQRELFGNGWQSEVSTGCSTRELVLMRDLTEVTMRDDRKCKVATGVLDPEPYLGTRIKFNSVEDPMSVQIDHIVPLSVAWQMGAWEWDSNTRVTFSNDMANLIASDGPTNNSKGDKTPSRWMPKNAAFTCEYSASYIGVTEKWGLSMADADKNKLIEVLAQC